MNTEKVISRNRTPFYKWTLKVVLEVLQKTVLVILKIKCLILLIFNINLVTNNNDPVKNFYNDKYDAVDYVLLEDVPNKVDNLLGNSFSVFQINIRSLTITAWCWLSIPLQNIRKPLGFLMLWEDVDNQHWAVIG